MYIITGLLYCRNMRKRFTRIEGEEEGRWDGDRDRDGDGDEALAPYRRSRVKILGLDCSSRLVGDLGRLGIVLRKPYCRLSRVDF